MSFFQFHLIVLAPHDTANLTINLTLFHYIKYKPDENIAGGLDVHQLPGSVLSINLSSPRPLLRPRIRLHGALQRPPLTLPRIRFQSLFLRRCMRPRCRPFRALHVPALGWAVRWLSPPVPALLLQLCLCLLRCLFLRQCLLRKFMHSTSVLFGLTFPAPSHSACMHGRIVGCATLLRRLPFAH